MSALAVSRLGAPVRRLGARAVTKLNAPAVRRLGLLLLEMEWVFEL